MSLFFDKHYNMTVWILAGNYISFIIAAGLIRLHMPEARSVAPRKARYLAFLRSETNRCYVPRSRDLDI